MGFCAELRLEFSISLSPKNARADERFHARHPDCAALPGVRPSGTSSREHTDAARITSRHPTSNFETSPIIAPERNLETWLGAEVVIAASSGAREDCCCGSGATGMIVVCPIQSENHPARALGLPRFRFG